MKVVQLWFVGRDVLTSELETIPKLQLKKLLLKALEYLLQATIAESLGSEVADLGFENCMTQSSCTPLLAELC